MEMVVGWKPQNVNVSFTFCMAKIYQNMMVAFIVKYNQTIYPWDSGIEWKQLFLEAFVAWHDLNEIIDIFFPFLPNVFSFLSFSNK